MNLVEIKNHNVCLNAIHKKKEIETNFFELAKILYWIRRDRKYLAGWTDWETFCMELGMAQTSIDKLLLVYQRYVVDYGMTLSELSETRGWAVLAEALPVVKGPELAKRWVDKAKVLSLRDMRDEIHETRTGVSQVECRHLDTVTICLCKDCGYKFRDFDKDTK